VPGEELQVVVEHLIVVVGVVDEVAVGELVLRVAVLLPAAEREGLLARGCLDLLEELIDRLVTERGDADALPAAHQLDRHARAGERLARAGRALHEEVAAVERGRHLDRRRVEPRARGAPLEHVTQSRVAR
jgi:hypothetical protein